jgi:hypothetical protein
MNVLMMIWHLKDDWMISSKEKEKTKKIYLDRKKKKEKR